MHVQYEMFLDSGGKKISKSAGNVFTPQVWFRYGSPQSLNLLILKRFVGAKSGSVEDIPTHMDEFDDLEEIYFSNAKEVDLKEQTKLSGLYQYCWMLKPPVEPSVHIPYNMLIGLSNVAPEGSEANFTRDKLREYGYIRQGDRGLEDRLRFALNWVKDFGEARVKAVTLIPQELESIKALVKALEKAESEEEYQSSVFDVARAEKLPPKKLFQIIYKILIGRSQGPRFGPYVLATGKDKVIRALNEVVDGK
jgi:lysyl-tRNA synthetase class 1